MADMTPEREKELRDHIKRVQSGDRECGDGQAEWAIALQEIFDALEAERKAHGETKQIQHSDWITYIKVSNSAITHAEKAGAELEASETELRITKNSNKESMAECERLTILHAEEGALRISHEGHIVKLDKEIERLNLLLEKYRVVTGMWVICKPSDMDRVITQMGNKEEDDEGLSVAEVFEENERLKARVVRAEKMRLEWFDKWKTRGIEIEIQAARVEELEKYYSDVHAALKNFRDCGESHIETINRLLAPHTNHSRPCPKCGMRWESEQEAK